MHVKLITSGSQDFSEPVASLIKVSSRGLIGHDKQAFEKRAGAAFGPELDRLIESTPKDEPLIHLLAIGATEDYSCNRNGDGFKRACCKKYHPTFTKYAYLYRDHCFVAGTSVVLADRRRVPIESVKTGDAVATRAGARPVTRVMETPYNGPGYRIRFSGIPTEMYVTPEHPILALRRSQIHCRHKYNRLHTTEHGLNCREWRDGLRDIAATYQPAGSLQPGDYALIPKPQHGSTIVEPAFASLVGWVAAEGYLGANGIIQFTFSTTNQDDIHSVTTCLQAQGLHVTVTPRPDTNCTMLSACNKQLHEELSTYIVGVKNDKRLTDKLLTWDAASLYTMLAAYIDGDGHTADNNVHKGQLRIRSSSQQMLAILADVVRALGIPTTVNYDTPAGYMVSPTNSKVYTHNGSGCVTANATHSPTLTVNTRKHVVRNGRNWATPLLDNMYLAKIIEIEPVHINEPVYNLEVEEQHHYIANEVVVHNCNKDPHKSYGRVKLSAWHDAMKRIELIVALNGSEDAAKRHNALFADKEMHKLASGKEIPVSMACVTDPDYPVLTRDRGYVGIADVQVDDYVWTAEGRWRRVYRLNRRVYTGEVFKFRVNGQPLPLELTADHPMWAKVFEGSRELAAIKTKARRYFKDAESFTAQPASWTHASHIGVGDRFFYRPVTHYPGYGRIDDTRLATILGYYLAEGSFRYNDDRASTTEFSCNMDDSLPRRLPKILATMYPDITVDIQPRANSVSGLSVLVNNTAFSEFIRTYIGAGVRSKTIPPEIFNATPEVKLAFLGAWLDGDGWVDKKGGHWSSCSAKLVLQGRDLLASIGIPSSIYKIDHSTCETSGYENSGVEYTLNVAHLDLWNLSEASEKVASYPTVCQQRQKPACMRLCPDGAYAYRIAEVSSRFVSDIQTYNFEVEEDESYSLGGFVSHNCTVPLDVCSYCGNKAPTRKEYCEALEDGGHCKAGGLKKNIGALVEIDGGIHHLHADNPDPRFFDISHVYRPADRIAYVSGLLKAASLHNTVSGSALAEALGVSVPAHLLIDSTQPRPVQRMLKLAYQLADQERTLPTDPVVALRGTFANSVQQVTDTPTVDAQTTLGQVKLGQLLKAMADERLALPLPHFIRTFTECSQEKSAAVADVVSRELPGIYTRLLAQPRFVDRVRDNPYVPAATTNDYFRRWSRKQASALSLRDACVNERLTRAIIRQEEDLPLLTEDGIKLASDQSAATRLAEEYALYKLAFLGAIPEEDPELQLTVSLALLQNYVHC